MTEWAPLCKPIHPVLRTLGLENTCLGNEVDASRAEKLVATGRAADHEKRKGDTMTRGRVPLEALQFPEVQSRGHGDHILDIVAPG